MTLRRDSGRNAYAENYYHQRPPANSRGEGFPAAWRCHSIHYTGRSGGTRLRQTFFSLATLPTTHYDPLPRFSQPSPSEKQLPGQHGFPEVAALEMEVSRRPCCSRPLMFNFASPSNPWFSFTNSASTVEPTGGGGQSRETTRPEGQWNCLKVSQSPARNSSRCFFPLPFWLSGIVPNMRMGLCGRPNYGPLRLTGY